MDKNEIKKALYKQKPLAKVDFKKDNEIFFSTELVINGVKRIITFVVPTSEDFGKDEIQAQLLIRWMDELVE